MRQKTLKERLRTNPWFERLSDEHYEKMVSIATIVKWPAGKDIFREGDEDLYLYLILKGRVAIDISYPTRGRVRILTLNEDEIFGWSAVLPVVKIKTAGAHTILDTEAVAFDADALREICEQDHELGFLVYRRLTNVIAGRLSATRMQLLDMYSTGTESEIP